MIMSNPALERTRKRKQKGIHHAQSDRKAVLTDPRDRIEQRGI
jgi:hypothetical protein